MKTFYGELIFLKKRLYQHHFQFNNFNNITNEDLKKIEKDITIFKESFNKRTSLNNKFNFYIQVINALVNQNNTFKTYDEKILFLIKILDPNLEALTIFYKYNFPSLEEIKQIEKTSPQEALNLIRKRKSDQQTCYNEIKNKLGFFDQELIKYENIYQKKYNSKLSSLQIVKKDFSKEFFKFTTNIKTFTISPDRLNELEETAKNFISLFSNESLYTTTIFHALFNSEILNLKTIEEQIIFLILTCDSNLTLLTIYEDESNWRNVKERSLNEVGFFNKELIRIEKIYHKTLKPEQKVSQWLKI